MVNGNEFLRIPWINEVDHVTHLALWRSWWTATLFNWPKSTDTKQIIKPWMHIWDMAPLDSWWFNIYKILVSIILSPLLIDFQLWAENYAVISLSGAWRGVAFNKSKLKPTIWVPIWHANLTKGARRDFCQTETRGKTSERNNLVRSHQSPCTMSCNTKKNLVYFSVHKHGRDAVVRIWEGDLFV